MGFVKPREKSGRGALNWCGILYNTLMEAGKKWPHAPPHWVFEPGIFMVTGGTFRKIPYFHSPDRLDFFRDRLFKLSDEFGWQLQAWAILTNHYHFVAASPEEASNLSKFLGKLHMTTAKELNKLDSTPGRKVWFEYWDSRITFETSYLSRLKYVHFNPVKHGITENAEDYPWCSASWFSSCATPAFAATVNCFKTDRIQVTDDF